MNRRFLTVIDFFLRQKSAVALARPMWGRRAERRLALPDDNGDETGETSAGDGKAYGAEDRIFAVMVGEGKVENKEWDEERDKKDGPGPVMVSDTLCPAIHILGTSGDRTDVRTFVRSDGRTQFYWTSSPSGPLPCINFSIVKKTAQGQ